MHLRDWMYARIPEMTRQRDLALRSGLTPGFPLALSDEDLLFRYRPGDPTPASFSRDLEAWFTTAEGERDSVAEDVVRDHDYALDPISGELIQTTLLERRSTNLFRYSNQINFGNHVDGWRGFNGTDSTNQIASLTEDGWWRLNRTNPATGVTQSEMFQTHSNRYIVPTPGTTYVQSLRFRHDGDQTLHFNFSFYDTTNGHLTAVPTFIPLPNGEFLAYATYTSRAGDTGVRACNINGLTNPTVAGDWTYIDVKESMFEEGTLPSSFIETNGATVTRPSEFLVFPIDFNPRSLTFWVDAIMGSVSGNGLYSRFFELGGTSSNESGLALYHNGGAVDGMVCAYNNGTSASGFNAYRSVSDMASGPRVRFRIVVEEGLVRFYISRNGAAEELAQVTVTGGFAESWTRDLLYINAQPLGTANHNHQHLIDFMIADGVKEQEFFLAREIPLAKAA